MNRTSESLITCEELDGMVREEDNLRFWETRSTGYNRLYWVNDRSYLETIIEMACLRNDHIVLDIGTGTGAVANGIKDLVKHVVAMDISDSMLKRGIWQGVSVVKWDIGFALFAANLFDRVLARMVFHGITDDLDRAVSRCHDLLKTGGMIIVAEGIPPVVDEEVIEWYSNMFKLKERRRTFTLESLGATLKNNGFKNTKFKLHFMENFSVNNWLESSGLDSNMQRAIYDLHINASSKIKEAYNMRVIDGECLVRTCNAIIAAQK